MLLSFMSSFAQEIETEKEQAPVKIDSLYREDQFYLGLNYNRLLDGPVGVSQQKISLGVAAGFLRDRKSTRLNSSHVLRSRMPSSA